VQASDADALVERAREEARGDRHDEAIRAFKQAIQAAPDRRSLWLVELADQLTWSGRLTEAIDLYREAASSSDREEERRARRGLARALSWKGEHEASLVEYARVLELNPHDHEVRHARAQVLIWAHDNRRALAEYTAIARDHPDDLEARRQVGRLQSWRGRHRGAASHLHALLADNPGDREATVILAESFDWMGRPDRAVRLLRGHVAADTEDTRAADLLEHLELQRRPAVRLDWRESHQSDDMDVSLLSADASLHPSDGRGTLGLRHDRGSYRPGGSSTREIVVQRPGLYGGYRINDSIAWNGALYATAIDAPGTMNDETIPTYETYFTLWPHDLVRVDLGVSRWTLDSEEALLDGLYATQANASIDFHPDDLTRFTARFNAADFSDGNDRVWWQFEIDRRVWREPRVMMGYRYTGFDFSARWQRGYYSPDLYHSHEIVLRSWGWLGRGFHWDLRSSIGYENEVPGDSRLIWNAGAGVSWQMRPRLHPEISYDFFSSSAATTRGFKRGTGRFTLRYRF
jgi:tetratricopeptide (TPR) repeat protein